MIRNDFDGYIAHIIDGYLFNDLDTIHDDIKKQDGNLAYLYLFAICSAMEFLGLLLRENPPTIEHKGKLSVDSSHALPHYIAHYLKPTNPSFDYDLLQTIAPTLIRNGLAHSYATKGPIAVGRAGFVDSSLHMSRDKIGNDLILIHVDQLYDDFKESYIKRVKPLIQPGGSLYDRAKNNYEAIRAIYSEEVNRILERSD